MKKWIYFAVITSVATLSACNSECQYAPAKLVKAKVSVSPANPSDFNCVADPVDISISWAEGSQDVRTTDGRNLPRACAAAMGLLDGADLEINVIEYESGGSSFPISPCEPYHASLPNISWNACDKACDVGPTCPESPPTKGQPCSGDMSCHYGAPINCPLEPGTMTTFYDCINHVWWEIPRDNCETCGGPCGPSPCVTCAEAAIDKLQPPDQYDFCKANSATLYEALWSCTCVTGGACEPVCNSTCTGGAPSKECATCVTTNPMPTGCVDVFEACING